MALVFVGKMNVPNYIAESSDITQAGTIDGASIIGSTVLLTDTNIWKVILDDLTLENYALPISFNGSVDIGAVHLDQQLSDSVEIVPHYNTKLVATSGTAVSLTEGTEFAMSLSVFPKAGNVGNVYFGDSGVDKSSSKQITIANDGSPVYLDAPVGYTLNLNTFYIDADNANDGVYFMYLA